MRESPQHPRIRSNDTTDPEKLELCRRALLSMFRMDVSPPHLSVEVRPDCSILIEFGANRAAVSNVDNAIFNGVMWGHALGQLQAFSPGAARSFEMKVPGDHIKNKSAAPFSIQFRDLDALIETILSMARFTQYRTSIDPDALGQLGQRHGR